MKQTTYCRPCKRETQTVVKVKVDMVVRTKAMMESRYYACKACGGMR